MAFCLPKSLSLKLQFAAKEGKLEMRDLYNKTSGERHRLFAQYVGDANAKMVNAGFERSMASTQRNAMANWVKATFIGKEAPKKTDIFDKISGLSKEGLLTPEAERNFMAALVENRLGVEVTADVARQVNEKSLKLEEAYLLPHDKFGIPNEEYFRLKLEMDNWLKSLKPTHNLKVLTSVAGRGALLFSFKSPITNIVGNTVMSIEQSFERRVMNRMYAGKVTKSLVSDFLQSAASAYKAGKFDTARADSYSDGTKTLGEVITHSQGPGLIRKVGRFYEDVVFNQLLSKPDVWFAHRVFADAANLMATKVAKEENLTGDEFQKRVDQLFLDAASPAATTPEGMLVREYARAEAMFSTFQNESTASNISTGVRKLINSATGDVTLGDQILPFAVTPANVTSMTLDAGGLGVIKAGLAMYDGAIAKFRLGEKKPLVDALRLLLRSGFGILASYLLSLLIDPDDFIGLWPTKPSEQELLKLKGGNSNMIRVNGTWISMDYFGFLGSPLIGIMYAKKYGKDLPSAVFAYAAGASLQAMQIPGLEESRNLVDGIASLKPDEYESELEKFKKVGVGLIDQVRARVVPAFVYDIAKAMDTSEREVDPTKVSDKLKSALPGFRQTLPEKVDVFGAVLKGEPWYSVMLFGARVKTGRESAVTTEMNRLEQQGQLPSLTRPEKTSSTVKQLKVQIGDARFAEAMTWFRNRYYTEVYKEINKSSYKRKSAEDQKKLIDGIKSDAQASMLKRYHYKKPRT